MVSLVSLPGDGGTGRGVGAAPSTVLLLLPRGVFLGLGLGVDTNPGLGFWERALLSLVLLPGLGIGAGTAPVLGF